MNDFLLSQSSFPADDSDYFQYNQTQVKFRGGVWDLDPSTNEFVMSDGSVWVIYSHNATLRAHSSPYDYVDRSEGMYLPLVMRKDKAVYVLEKAIALLNFVDWSNSTGNALLDLTQSVRRQGGTLGQHVNEITNYISSIAIEMGKTDGDVGGDGDNSSESVKKNIINMLISLSEYATSMDYTRMEEALSFTILPRKIILEDVHNVSLFLKCVSELCVGYSTYDERFINFQNGSFEFYIIVRCIHLILILESYFQPPVESYTDKSSFILHTVMSIIVDVTTDRFSYELYIKGRNRFCNTVYSNIKRQFPILNDIKSIKDLQKIVYKRDLTSYLIDHKLNLYPSMLYFQLAPAIRIKNNYQTFIDQIKKECNNPNFQASFMKKFNPQNMADANVMYTLLERLASRMTDYSTYDIDSCAELLPLLIGGTYNL